MHAVAGFSKRDSFACRSLCKHLPGGPTSSRHGPLRPAARITEI
jgi:hypothetical protein